MFKKYMKKILAFTLAGALAFSGAQIAGVGGADVASAAPVTAVTAGATASIAASVDTTSKGVGDDIVNDLAYDGTKGAFTVADKYKTGYDFVVAHKSGADLFGIKAAPDAAKVRAALTGNDVAIDLAKEASAAVEGVEYLTVKAVGQTDTTDVFVIGTVEVRAYLVANAVAANKTQTTNSTWTMNLNYGQDSDTVWNNADKDDIAEMATINKAGSNSVATNGQKKEVYIKVANSVGTLALAANASNTNYPALVQDTMLGTAGLTTVYDDKGAWALFTFNATAGQTAGSRVFTIANDGAQIATVTVNIRDKSNLQYTKAAAATDFPTTVFLSPTETATYDDILITKKVGGAAAAPDVAQATGGAGKTYLTASSKNTGIATVGLTDKETAVITGVTAGTTTVTIKALTSAGATADPATDAVIASKDITVTVGAAQELTVAAADGTTLGTTGVTTTEEAAAIKKFNDNGGVQLDLLKTKDATLTITSPANSTVTITPVTAGIVTVSGNTITAAKAGTTAVKVVSSAVAGAAEKTVTFNVTVNNKPENALTLTNGAGKALTQFANTTTAPAATDAIETLDLKVTKEDTLSVVPSEPVSITYASSDSNVVGVDFAGKLTAKSIGNAWISVSTLETTNTRATTKFVYVKVQAKPNNTITTASDNVTLDLKTNKTFDLAASCLGNATLSYATSNANVAAVDQTGKITAKAEGKATITITATEVADYVKTEKTINVLINANGANTIKIAKADDGSEVTGSVDLEANGTLGIKATSLDNTAVSVKSLNVDVATVATADGVTTITAVKSGSAVLQLDVPASTKYAAATTYLVVNVKGADNKITADASLALTVGKSGKISATAADGATLTFLSSDDSIATVAADGTVTGTGAGTAVITIQSTSGAQAFTVVTVKAAAKKKVSFKNTKKSFKASALAKSFSVIKKSGGGKVTYKVTKGNKKFISVSTKGKVTVKKGAAKGTYKIKVTVAAKGAYKKTSKTIKVTIK